MPSRRRLLPSLNAIRAFEAAARLGSFKEAAAELGVTHGAISRHIQLLEQWLGPPALFQRLTRRVELTPTGAALLAETRPALDRLSAAAERHRARDGKAAPALLRVNALATFTLRWLLPRLSQFRAKHPEIEVRLSTSNEPVDALQEPHDLIIRGGPDTFYGFT
ncbi:MAG: LysR family transcriptional regulator, partial [Bradyrhizobium sp.]|nr:LysR family transcriptional regulator [Bradyrhizobium sp.]